jgi:hypothetical protein
VLITRADYERVERLLRDQLAVGRPLGEALRELHGPQAVGLVFLYPAVEVVCGLPRRGAMRLVVRETLSLRVRDS